jgi:hypothetical protein
LQEQIVTALQNECSRKKTTKSLKKHLGFDSSVCETFTETTSFGCSHQKKTSKKWSKQHCGCKDKQKSFKKSPRQFSMPKRKVYFKRRPQNKRAKQTSCFICKKPGHWASQCPLRSKTKVQIKIMDLFSTGYDPAEWDLVSHRSDGEYLSLSEDSDDEGDMSHPESPTFSDHSSDSSNIEELNFLDIKMMSSFQDLSSLLAQRSSLQAKLSVLTPGQFSLIDRYTSQLEHVQQQIQSLQQPSVVNIHHYTPTDAEFESANLLVSLHPRILKEKL